MKIDILKFRKRIIALALLVGALPFIFIASAYAGETTESGTQKPGLWDDYKKPVGFTYGASARIQANYLWRGIYAGGLNLQVDGTVGYGGLYATAWWNIGAMDWTFSAFEPEFDFLIGFNRWGLNAFLLYIHNFNCRFFDFTNYPDRGNRLEVDVSYTLSPKIPLTILWATRFGASDGYIVCRATDPEHDVCVLDTVRAWSSYLELSYTQALPYGLSLYGAVGLTPWKSCYTLYEGDFAVNNIDIRLRKDWDIHERVGLMLQGELCLHPYFMAWDKASVQWHPGYPWFQSLNLNLAIGVYLK